MLKLIACVDRCWALGLGQQLLFHIPGDLRWFRANTWGKAVLLGRRTLETLPGGQPLPGRQHLLLSRSIQNAPPGVILCSTLQSALQQAENFPEVWVIGGASVYQAMLPHCREAYITQVDAQRPADCFLSPLDMLPEWSLASSSPWREEVGLRYRFCQYFHG